MTSSVKEAKSSDSQYYDLNQYSGQLQNWSLNLISPDNLVWAPVGAVCLLASVVGRVFEGCFMLILNACLYVRNCRSSPAESSTDSKTKSKKGDETGGEKSSIARTAEKNTDLWSTRIPTDPSEATSTDRSTTSASIAETVPQTVVLSEAEDDDSDSFDETVILDEPSPPPVSTTPEEETLRRLKNQFDHVKGRLKNQVDHVKGYLNEHRKVRAAAVGAGAFGALLLAPTLASIGAIGAAGLGAKKLWDRQTAKPADENTKGLIVP